MEFCILEFWILEFWNLEFWILNPAFFFRSWIWDFDIFCGSRNSFLGTVSFSLREDFGEVWSLNLESWNLEFGFWSLDSGLPAKKKQEHNYYIGRTYHGNLRYPPKATPQEIRAY